MARGASRRRVRPTSARMIQIRSSSTAMSQGADQSRRRDHSETAHRLRQPQAFAAVGLCDVAPDGTSAFVTLGVLNLSHRKSHEFPEAMKTGKVCRRDSAPQARRADHSERPPPAPRHLVELLADGVAKSQTRRRSPSIRPASHIELPVLHRPAASVRPLRAFRISPHPVRQRECNRRAETREIYWNVETETAAFDIKSDDGRYVIDEIGTEVASTRTQDLRVSRTIRSPRTQPWAATRNTGAPIGMSKSRPR